MSYIHEFKQKRIVAVPFEDHPLTEEEFCILDRSSRDLDYYKSGSFYIDNSVISKTRLGRKDIVVHPDLLEILQSSQMIEWYRSFKGSVRKVSAAIIHRMKEGDLILPHTDNAAPFNWTLSSILHLKSEYSGGGFFSKDFFGEYEKTDTNEGDIVLFDPGRKHFVNYVSSGERYTITSLLGRW